MGRKPAAKCEVSISANHHLGLLAKGYWILDSAFLLGADICTKKAIVPIVSVLSSAVASARPITQVLKAKRAWRSHQARDEKHKTRRFVDIRFEKSVVLYVYRILQLPSSPYYQFREDLVLKISTTNLGAAAKLPLFVHYLSPFLLAFWRPKNDDLPKIPKATINFFR